MVEPGSWIVPRQRRVPSEHDDDSDEDENLSKLQHSTPEFRWQRLCMLVKKTIEGKGLEMMDTYVVPIKRAVETVPLLQDKAGQEEAKKNAREAVKEDAPEALGEVDESWSR